MNSQCIANSMVERCMPSAKKANVGGPRIKALLLFDKTVTLNTLVIFDRNTQQSIEKKKLENFKSTGGKNPYGLSRVIGWHFLVKQEEAGRNLGQIKQSMRSKYETLYEWNMRVIEVCWVAISPPDDENLSPILIGIFNWRKNKNTCRRVSWNMKGETEKLQFFLLPL